MTYFDGPEFGSKPKREYPEGIPTKPDGTLDFDALTDDTPSNSPTLLPLLLRVREELREKLASLGPDANLRAMLDEYGINGEEFTRSVAETMKLAATAHQASPAELLACIGTYRFIPASVTDTALTFFMMGRAQARLEAERTS